MGLKTAGVGHFLIPTAPAAGASCTSGAANTFTTTPVQLIASTAAAIYITAVSINMSTTSKPTYVAVQLMTGGSGSETTVDQQVLQIPSTSGATGTVVGATVLIEPPVPVANATRISVKTADSVGTLAALVTLTCINQSNVVDDGTAMSANVTQLLGTAWLTPGTAGTPDVNAKLIGGQTASASGTITFPNATLASTTNITAGTITTTTNLTNAGPDTSGTTTLLGRLSSTRATNLDVLSLRNGTAQAGAAGSITLDSGASATDSLYNGLWVLIESGTGLGQSRLITGYTGSSKVATVAPNWTTNPDSTSVFALFPAGKISGVTLTDTLTTYTGNTVQTGDSFARIGAAGVGLTNLGDTRIAHLDADVSSRMATYTQPTGFLAATFPTGTIANTTNITAGTITTTTNLTNAGPDTSGTTTLLGRLSATRATNLDALSLRNGTAQAGAAGSLTLDSGASATDSLYNGLWMIIESGTGAGQSRLITGYTGSTKVATVAPNWTTNPDATSIFALVPAAKLSGVTLADTLTTYTGDTPQTGDAYARIGAAGAGLTAIGDTRVAHLDADVSSRLALASYTAPDNTSVAAIKTKTDSLTFTVAGKVDGNIRAVNSITISGSGTAGSPWGP